MNLIIADDNLKYQAPFLIKYLQGNNTERRKGFNLLRTTAL